MGSKRKYVETDWCMIELQTTIRADPLDFYLSTVGEYNDARDRIKVGAGEIPSGWCSWYEYFEHPSEEAMKLNLDVISKNKKKIPLNLVQLDDGFQSAWGDWYVTDQRRFPQGMKYIADMIKEKGFTAGLWLAPFSIDKFSQRIKDFPHWVLRYANGKPADCGNNGRFTVGLDITKTEVQEYVRDLISTAVNKWGFTYLKLDFLYSCIALGVREDQTLTRAEAFQLGLRTIRDAAGADTIILGCGCPYGAAVGWVDTMRVSADAGPSWFPPFPFGTDRNNLPACRNSVRNSITRMNAHNRLWVNDPDCILIRDNTQLSVEELYGLCTVVSMTGGSLLLSDRLDNISEARFKLAQTLFPPSGKNAVALDLLEREIPEVLSLSLSSLSLSEWTVMAFCNWSDYLKEHTIDIFDILPGNFKDVPEVHILEFWSQSYHRLRRGHVWNTGNIKVHSAKMFAIRPVKEGIYTYINTYIYIYIYMLDKCITTLFHYFSFLSPPLAPISLH